jgi:hypothetical protein
VKVKAEAQGRLVQRRSPVRDHAQLAVTPRLKILRVQLSVVSGLIQNGAQLGLNAHLIDMKVIAVPPHVDRNEQIPLCHGRFWHPLPPITAIVADGHQPSSRTGTGLTKTNLETHQRDGADPAGPPS